MGTSSEKGTEGGPDPREAAPPVEMGGRAVSVFILGSILGSLAADEHSPAGLGMTC